MKRKRLDRDLWTAIQEKRYRQTRLEAPASCPAFSGIAALLWIDRVSRVSAWDYPDGSVVVAAGGMVWLELIPDGARHVLTAMIDPGAGEGGRITEWYCDITGGSGTDPDGVSWFDDCWLDLIARPPCPAYPEACLKEDDRDELDAALDAGELTEEDYRAALAEAERLKAGLFSDLHALEGMCMAFYRELAALFGGDAGRHSAAD